MRVQQFMSEYNNPIPNQFMIGGTEWIDGQEHHGVTFQSYDAKIAFRDNDGKVWLDEKYWTYSRTTSKWRNRFLNSTTKDTLAKIKSGEYTLANLNGGAR